jgi:hypothetical protein
VRDDLTAHLLVDARLRLVGVVFAAVVLVVSGLLQLFLPMSQWLPASLGVGVLAAVALGLRWLGQGGD